MNRFITMKYLYFFVFYASATFAHDSSSLIVEDHISNNSKNIVSNTLKNKPPHIASNKPLSDTEDSSGGEDEATYAGKTIPDLLETKNLPLMSQAAHFLLDQGEYKSAKCLYESIIKVKEEKIGSQKNGSDLLQIRSLVYIKTSWGAGMLNSSNRQDWTKGATYMLESACDYEYDRAQAFLEDLKFKVSDLKKMDRNKAIKLIVDLRKNRSDDDFWAIP